MLHLLRRMDSNHRPLGYEPNELPAALSRVKSKIHPKLVILQPTVSKANGFRRTKRLPCGTDKHASSIPTATPDTWDEF